MKTFQFKFDSVRYTIMFCEEVNEKEAFRQSMKKLGRQKLAESYCEVFKVSHDQYLIDCHRFPVPIRKNVPQAQRATIIDEEEVKQDIVGQKRKPSFVVPKHSNPNHKRDEYLKKRREWINSTKLGLSAAAITVAYISSMNQYRVIKTMFNVMLKNAKSLVRLPPEQKVKDNGKQLYEQGLCLSVCLSVCLCMYHCVCICFYDYVLTNTNLV
jgi:hypothetical protein